MNRNTLDAATRAAVDWLLRLEREPPDGPLHRAHAAWLAEAGEHRQAWTRVTHLLDEPLAQLHEAERQHPGHLQAASRSLRAASALSRRKLLGGGLGALALGLGGASLGNRFTPLDGWLADLHTATGERRRVTLADGSRLTLNARSAVDVRFDTRQRLLWLREGELQVEVARDPRRPFRVACQHGSVEALGTRFQVRQQADGSLASVQEHSVLLRSGSASQPLLEGQAAWFDGQRIENRAPSLLSDSDWTGGLIRVHDEPLAHLVEALRPYRAGLLRISPEAARLHVVGVFSLDDSERSLRSLSETLPVRIERPLPWLTRIALR